MYEIKMFSNVFSNGMQSLDVRAEKFLTVIFFESCFFPFDKIKGIGVTYYHSKELKELLVALGRLL